MNTDIFKAYGEVMEVGLKIYKLNGDFERIAKLTKYLIEKSELYRGEGNIKGAEAIEGIVLDNLQTEFHSVHNEFKKEMKNWKQEYKKLKDVCNFYGIPVPSLKSEKVINFYK